MLHHLVEAWEAKLNALLIEVDSRLEEQFGSLFLPHPARPRLGSTANPQHDGLFRITASYSPGFGSVLGKGYVLQIDPVTLDNVSDQQLELIRQTAVQLIQDGLDKAMPGRHLRVQRENNVWKLVGDLSLSHGL
jgi:hypothetical protein